MVWLYVTFVRIKARILKKKLWYISGEVTGDPYFRGKFRTTERALKRRGLVVLNPVKYERNGKAWAWYLKRDIRKLSYCYGLIQLKDWTQSRGSMVEYSIALKLEMKVLSIASVKEAI
jgi:hypothetical protein